MEDERRVEYHAAIDYLRITYTRPDAADVALVHYQAAVAEISGIYGYQSEAPKAWQWRGYSGTQSGTACWGLREDGCILQVSGEAAAAAALLDLPYTGVPRMDIQVTTWGEASPASVPRMVALASEAARGRVAHRPWAIRLVDGFGSGDTAYLGSRSSAWFVRVYDKEAESGEAQYKGSVRYEVEAHDEAAAALWERFGGKDVPQEKLAAVVAGYLGVRGYDLGSRLLLAHVAPSRVLRTPTNTERTLRWLSEGVAPTVTRLVRQGISPEALRGQLRLDLPKLPRRRRYVSSAVSRETGQSLDGARKVW